MSLLILHKKNQSRRRHLARAHEYASQHEEQFIPMMKDPTWEADFADQVLRADVGSIQQTLAAVGELTFPISAVASFAEPAVPTVAVVCGLRTCLTIPAHHMVDRLRSYWTRVRSSGCGFWLSTG